MSMLEADCTRCGEIFIPHDVTPPELIHGETYAGKPCGGIGIVLGEWLLPGQCSCRTQMMSILLGSMEVHGRHYPNCNDPDCEFHFPDNIPPGIIPEPGFCNGGCGRPTQAKVGVIDGQY